MTSIIYVGMDGRIQHEEKNHHWRIVYRLSDTVCRCVAAIRTSRGNTHRSHTTRRGRRTPPSLGGVSKIEKITMQEEKKAHATELDADPTSSDDTPDNIVYVPEFG